MEPTWSRKGYIISIQAKHVFSSRSRSEPGQDGNYACQRNSLSPSVLGWLGINEFVKKHPSCRPDLVLEQEHGIGVVTARHGTPSPTQLLQIVRLPEEVFEEERECGKGGKCGAGKKGAQDHGGLSRPRSRHWAEEDDRSTCGRNGTRK